MMSFSAKRVGPGVLVLEQRSRCVFCKAHQRGCLDLTPVLVTNNAATCICKVLLKHKASSKEVAKVLREAQEDGNLMIICFTQS
mmetsp:Transcript_15707/g.36053  ORF Transcript_15707/g.36053 Transcript_15707/m.36053 type:complete len:84 (+) Transcript_15707:1519-1770(+)